VRSRCRLVPLVAPDRYVDTFERTFLREPLDGLFLLGWTLAPFAGLAMYAFVSLRNSHVSAREAIKCRRGVLGALIPALVLGWFLHWPQTGGGASFGDGFFPLEAAILMPLGCALGRRIPPR